MARWARGGWRAARTVAEWMGWVQASPETQEGWRQRWTTDLSDKTLGRLQLVGLLCVLVVQIAIPLLYVVEHEWSEATKNWIRVAIVSASACLVGIVIFVFSHRLPTVTDDNAQNHQDQ